MKYGLMQEGDNLQKHQFTVNDKLHQLIEAGKIRVINKFKDFTSNAVILSNDDVVDIDTVVLATG